MIEKAEKALLLYLGFQINNPTVLDFIQYFLYLSNSQFDFYPIINESLSFVYVSLIGMFIYN